MKNFLLLKVSIKRVIYLLGVILLFTILLSTHQIVEAGTHEDVLVYRGTTLHYEHVIEVQGTPVKNAFGTYVVQVGEGGLSNLVQTSDGTLKVGEKVTYREFVYRKKGLVPFIVKGIERVSKK